MSYRSNLESWVIKRAADREETERLAYLNQPPPKNDPALFTPTRVRVLRPFCVDGRRVEVDEEITLAHHDATSLRASKKVEFL